MWAGRVPPHARGGVGCAFITRVRGISEEMLTHREFFSGHGQLIPKHPGDGRQLG